MTNIFFEDEKITKNDLYFVCYMIERIARKLKQPNKYVANIMGHDELCKKLSLANVLHSAPPQAVMEDWIGTYAMKAGNHDVTDVNRKLVERIPRESQMGKVYQRLILATLKPSEDYADGILRVYNDKICQTLDNYNCSAYYEPSPYIAESYHRGYF